MTLRVHGGIITDQTLAGSLLHFKIGKAAGNFGYVVSDGTVTLPPSTKGGPEGSTATYYQIVDDGEAVPESAAELALRQITEKCTVVQIGLVGDPDVTEIHIAIENTAIGWIDSNGDIDTAAMAAAIAALGSVTVPTTSGGTEGDNTAAPQTESIDLSDVTVTASPYQLA
tara:strand:- start:1099 stop:1608 length:510 start_codon:yes stop_codon:yes gene_type:complete